MNSLPAPRSTSSFMPPATLPHTVSMQPCQDSKDTGDRDCIEHTDPQRAVIANSLRDFESQCLLHSRSPVARKLWQMSVLYRSYCDGKQHGKKHNASRHEHHMTPHALMLQVSRSAPEA